MNEFDQSTKIIESDQLTFRIEEFLLDFRPMKKEEVSLELKILRKYL